MFSPKHLIGLIFASLLLVSCGPIPPRDAPAQTRAEQAAALAANKPAEVAKKSQAELKKEAARRAARIKANKEAAARRAARKREQAQESGGSSSNSGSGSGNTSPPKVQKKDPIKPKSKYRTAMAIPGKPGFVFNPWTNKAVDVRGVPGGMLVRDPNDGNPDHKFRVP